MSKPSEHQKQVSRQWWARNKEKQLAYSRGFRTKNPDYHKTWRDKNPERLLNSELKQKFGIDLSIYKKLLANQGGVCAICMKPESYKIRGKVIRLAVDHCHVTNKVRGLLCRSCNISLGLMGDSVFRLNMAATYLRHHAQ